MGIVAVELVHRSASRSQHMPPLPQLVTTWFRYMPPQGGTTTTEGLRRFSDSWNCHSDAHRWRKKLKISRQPNVNCLLLSVFCWFNMLFRTPWEDLCYRCPYCLRVRRKNISAHLPEDRNHRSQLRVCMSHPFYFLSFPVSCWQFVKVGALLSPMKTLCMEECLAVLIIGSN